MTAFQIAQLLIMYGPDAVKAIIATFNKPTISPADWDDLFAKVRQKSFDDYIAAALRGAAPMPSI